MTARKATPRKAATHPKEAPVADTVDDIDETLLTTSPDEWEWDTVATESPTSIVLENVGESVVLKYTGDRTIEREDDDPFDVFLFEGRDGKPYSMSKGYKLTQAMENVKIGEWVRITLARLIDTGQPAPLKDYRVEVKRESH